MYQQGHYIQKAFIVNNISINNTSKSRLNTSSSHNNNNNNTKGNFFNLKTKINPYMNSESNFKKPNSILANFKIQKSKSPYLIKDNVSKDVSVKKDSSIIARFDIKTNTVTLNKSEVNGETQNLNKSIINNKQNSSIIRKQKDNKMNSSSKSLTKVNIASKDNSYSELMKEKLKNYNILALKNLKKPEIKLKLKHNNIEVEEKPKNINYEYEKVLSRSGFFKNDKEGSIQKDIQKCSINDRYLTENSQIKEKIDTVRPIYKKALIKNNLFSNSNKILPSKKLNLNNQPLQISEDLFDEIVDEIKAENQPIKEVYIKPSLTSRK